MARGYPQDSGADEEAPPAAEVVVVAAGPVPAVVEAAEVAVARGAGLRAWIVGEGTLDLDCEVEHVGVTWPF